MTSCTVARINHDALKHNLARVRGLAPKSKVMSVVKAEGYGHGALQTARTLADSDGFAVARMGEGVSLRKGGVDAPIIVLSGFFYRDDPAICRQYQLQPVIHCAHQLQLVCQDKGRDPVDVWLKVDSGMHRAGFDPDDVEEVLRALRVTPGVGKISLMTHFSSADDLDDTATGQQIECFNATVKGFKLECSLANSAGVMGWPESHAEWVRPGLMLYGASPLKGQSADELGLRPVMTLESTLIDRREFNRGESVGYGKTWQCPEAMPIGLIECGYGDGYPRVLSQQAEVLVGGHRAKIIGRVSMDMISIDLRGLPEVSAGDPVILWGEGLPIEEIAAAAGTISYELMTKVTTRVMGDRG